MTARSLDSGLNNDAAAAEFKQLAHAVERRTQDVRSSVSTNRHILDSPGQGLSNADTGDNCSEAKALFPASCEYVRVFHDCEIAS